ncbi:MAG TPA: GAF domain-containing protein [Candidatus Limnocylindrales bacterium]|nr:GAF domain-containing protein [Candidatus Limnocylindrales bacterium]
MAQHYYSWLLGKGISLRSRFMVWSLGLLSAALLVNILFGSFFTRSQLHHAVATLQIQVATATAHRVESIVIRKLERLQDASVAMSFSPLGRDGQRLLGLSLLKNDPAFAQLTVINTDGQEVLKFSESRLYLGEDLKSQRDEPAFLESSRGNRFIGPISSAARDERYFTLAVPIQSRTKEFSGVLVAKVHLKFLSDVFAENHFGRGGYAYLVDNDANLIAPDDASLLRSQFNLKNLPKIAAFLQNSAVDKSPAEQSAGITGEQVLTSYAPIPTLGWAVVVEEPVQLALVDLTKLYRRAGLLLAVGLLAGAALIVWASGRFIKPIHELRQAVAIIGNGNLDHRAIVRSNDEIGQLAGEFNKMAEILTNSYASLEEKVQHRTSHISALYEVTRSVNQSLDLDRVLHEVVARIAQIFQFDTTRVYLFDAERKNLNLRAFADPQPELWSGIQRFSSGVSVVGHVAKTGETIVFSDVEKDPRYGQISTSGATRDAGFHFLAMLPIKIHGKLLGTLALNGRERRTLGDEELQLLTSMCEHMAVAVEKGNLFDQVVSRSRHLEVLNAIGAAVSQSLHLGEVLDQAVDKIAQTTGFDAAWIYQLDDSDGLLHLKAFHGVRDDMAATMGARSVDVDIGAQVVETGERLVFEDIQNDSLYRTLSQKAKAVTLGFESAAAFPVGAKEKIIGTLHVASRSKRHFSAEDLQLIESIARQIGVAIENALLFAEIDDKTKELAKTNQELRDATQAKSEFIAAMSHELRTPLNIVIGSSDLLCDGFFGALSDGQANALEKICRNARVLHKMINDLLTIARFDANRIALDISTVEIDAIMDQARAMVEQMNRDSHLEVRWDIDSNIPPLVTDSLKLEEILQNLIGNAFKFTPKGHVEVRVSNRPEQDRVEFSVADTGIGIAAEDRDKIFNAFEQLKDAHTGHFNGVGLGLNIVRRYLDIMQGEISVESQPGQGTTFTFSVPRSLQLNS